MDNLRDNCSITWETFNSTILRTLSLIQDPICSSYIESNSFIDIYKELLETLNGDDMSSYFDFFFEKSHVNNSIYVFIDEDAKDDFRFLAEDMNLIPKLKEIMEGETQQEKQVRTKRPEKDKISPIDKTQKKITQMQKSLIDLTLKISKITDLEVIKRYQEKMKRIEEYLKNTNTV